MLTKRIYGTLPSLIKSTGQRHLDFPEVVCSIEALGAISNIRVVSYSKKTVIRFF